MIENIEVCGFRVFPGEKIYSIDIKPEGFILIGGLNGTGKTSLYYSLGFAFGGNKGVFSRNRIRSLVNYNDNTEYARIKVTLQNKSINRKRLFSGIEEDYIIIERVIGKENADNDSIKVNNMRVNRSELRSILRQVHIDPGNPFQFVEQGQLASIISKSPDERLSLLDIFIPVSETAEKFKEGLRKIRNADRSLKSLKYQQMNYEREEFKARQIRENFEKKERLKKKLNETKALWAFALERELYQKKEKSFQDLNEAEKRIKEFTISLTNNKKYVASKELELKNAREKLKASLQEHDIIKEKKEKLSIEKYEFEQKILNLIKLEQELKDQEFISLSKAEELFQLSIKELANIEESINKIKKDIKNINIELKLLENQINQPNIVREALKVAKKKNINAVYTFTETEWKINDPIERKRLELILTPFRESITVLSFKDAKRLLTEDIKVPILIAHSKGARCNSLEIKGPLADYRSTLIEHIQREWDLVNSDFNFEYKRQVSLDGFALNLSYLIKYNYHQFIGKEAIKVKMESLRKKLSEYNETSEFLGKKKEKSKRGYETAKYQIELAKKFTIFDNMNKKRNNWNQRKNILSKEYEDIKKKEKSTLKLRIEIEKKIEKLENESLETKSKIKNFEKSINEDKNKLPYFKDEFNKYANEYNNHLKMFKEDIENGEDHYKQSGKIGTSFLLKDDIDRIEKSIDIIDDIPPGAIERHDRARKRLEKFKSQVQAQINVSDINPQQVREDIQQYEKILKQFIRNVNKNLVPIMNELGGEAKFQLKGSGLDEETWHYDFGLRIKAKFYGKKEIEVGKHCSLSGGEQTRLVIAILMALIKSQEQMYELPFLVLDEFDAQLDEPGLKIVMNILRKEIGAKQLIIFSPSRLEQKAIAADMMINFTNMPKTEPEIKIMAIRGK